MHGPINLGHPCAQQRQGHDHPPYRVMPKAKPLPCISYLQSILEYDPATGVFTWKESIGPRSKKGAIAGSIRTTGYVCIGLGRTSYLAHRIAWMFANNEDPCDLFVDHVNGDRSDNRIVNLRLCTHEENMRNSKMSKLNTSGYKGVTFDKERNKWSAHISINNKGVSLGRFDTPELAHMAYAKAAAELHGEFARAA